MAYKNNSLHNQMIHSCFLSFIQNFENWNSILQQWQGISEQLTKKEKKKMKKIEKKVRVYDACQ